MKKEPIGDLQLLFLRLIAEETPDVTTVLFNYGDAGKPLINLMAAREWMKHYCASADWLEICLQDVLEQEQEHIDWFVANRERFSNAPGSRRWKPKEQRSAQAEAWLRTLKNRLAGQAIGRMVSRLHPDRITYSDPIVDKRSGETHCIWLVQWLFGGMSDAEIVKSARVTRREAGKLRRDFAKKIGLDLNGARTGTRRLYQSLYKEHFAGRRLSH